jgi:hypothetical protein
MLRLYRAGNLMAEDHRLAQADSAEATMVIVVKVRAADAAGLDRYLDLCGAWRALFDAVVFCRRASCLRASAP